MRIRLMADVAKQGEIIFPAGEIIEKAVVEDELLWLPVKTLETFDNGNVAVYGVAIPVTVNDKQTYEEIA